MKRLEIKEVTGSKGGKVLDFVVSGRSLLMELEGRDIFLTPRLWSETLPVTVELRDLLLLEMPGDMPSGGVALYVCSMCGDFGCGVVSVKINREEDTIVWSDFGRENDYDAEYYPIERLGPFRFREAEYRQTLLNG